MILLEEAINHGDLNTSLVTEVRYSLLMIHSFTDSISLHSFISLTIPTHLQKELLSFRCYAW